MWMELFMSFFKVGKEFGCVSEKTGNSYAVSGKEMNVNGISFNAGKDLTES